MQKTKWENIRIKRHLVTREWTNNEKDYFLNTHTYLDRQRIMNGKFNVGKAKKKLHFKLKNKI